MIGIQGWERKSFWPGEEVLRPLLKTIFWGRPSLLGWRPFTRRVEAIAPRVSILGD